MHNSLIVRLLMDAAPDMPADFWWVSAAALGVLALAALIDARTGIVPDLLVMPALVAVTAAQGFYASWVIAAGHAIAAGAAGLMIWAINELWYKAFRHDALGMGDAKWTMLAVLCFGVMPALFAWGLGAVLALAFMGAARLTDYHMTRIAFAPFLLAGLCAGLWGCC